MSNNHIPKSSEDRIYYRLGKLHYGMTLNAMYQCRHLYNLSFKQQYLEAVENEKYVHKLRDLLACASGKDIVKFFNGVNAGTIANQFLNRLYFLDVFKPIQRDMAKKIKHIYETLINDGFFIADTPIRAIKSKAKHKNYEQYLINRNAKRAKKEPILKVCSICGTEFYSARNNITCDNLDCKNEANKLRNKKHNEKRKNAN